MVLFGLLAAIVLLAAHRIRVQVLLQRQEMSQRIAETAGELGIKVVTLEDHLDPGS